MKLIYMYTSFKHIYLHNIMIKKLRIILFKSENIVVSLILYLNLYSFLYVLMICFNFAKLCMFP